MRRMDHTEEVSKNIKISPWLLYAFLLFCQLLHQFFSIETLMAWQRFEIIQLLLDTTFPPWLDNNWQARPQHVPVGPRQLQSQGGALDTRDLRRQHPRHQEARPAGGDRRHQSPGRQGAVQISIKWITDIISIPITNNILISSTLYALWYLTEAVDNQHCLHCEVEAGLRNGVEPLPSRCPGLTRAASDQRYENISRVKIFSMTFICLFLLPHRSATSGGDFIFATANIRISDGIFLFWIIFPISHLQLPN